MKHLNVSMEKITKRNISELHAVMDKLNMIISADEVPPKLLGDSTRKAIKSFQKENKLRQIGDLDHETLNAMNADLTDVYYAGNKTRTEKLHGLLDKLGLEVSADEKKSRLVSNDTRYAIKKLEKELKLESDGKISDILVEKLSDKVVEKRFSAKTQIGKLHHSFQKVNEFGRGRPHSFSRKRK